MKRPILIWPSAQLMDVSRIVSVEEIQEQEFRDLVRDMFETMYAAGGVGLSAIQIGVPLRVFVMDKTGPAAQAPKTYINPTMVELIDDPEPVDEGCLSIPGIYDKVSRYPEALMSHLTKDGEISSSQFDGLEAHIVQHECEHLDGKMAMVPKSIAGRDILKRKIAKNLKIMRAR